MISPNSIVSENDIIQTAVDYTSLRTIFGWWATRWGWWTLPSRIFSGGSWYQIVRRNQGGCPRPTEILRRRKPRALHGLPRRLRPTRGLASLLALCGRFSCARRPEHERIRIFCFLRHRVDCTRRKWWFKGARRFRAAMAALNLLAPGRCLEVPGRGWRPVRPQIVGRSRASHAPSPCRPCVG